jgi:hypothetical protein
VSHVCHAVKACMIISWLSVSPEMMSDPDGETRRIW